MKAKENLTFSYKYSNLETNNTIDRMVFHKKKNFNEESMFSLYTIFEREKI